jgi:RNA polymerase sigma-70 factor (ECF subfamily)
MILHVHDLPVSDQVLLQRLAAGHTDSLGALFDRHHGTVRRFLSRLQVAPSDLDDLVQLTFLQVIHAAARFDPARPVNAWMFGLAAMVVRRHRRSLGRLLRKVAALAKEPRTLPPTPVELLGEQEAVQRAHRALAALSKKKREVFVMVVLERLSGEEVAHVLDIPLNTVWTRLHHARRELRAVLGEAEA